MQAQANPKVRIINASPNPNHSYRCKECQEEFPTPQALGGHTSSHTKRKKFQEKLAGMLMRAAAQRTTTMLPDMNDVPPPPPPPPPPPRPMSQKMLPDINVVPTPPPPSPPLLSGSSRVGEYDPAVETAIDDETRSDDGSSEGSVTSCLYL